MWVDLGSNPFTIHCRGANGGWTPGCGLEASAMQGLSRDLAMAGDQDEVECRKCTWNNNLGENRLENHGWETVTQGRGSVIKTLCVLYTVQIDKRFLGQI